MTCLSNATLTLSLIASFACCLLTGLEARSAEQEPKSSAKPAKSGSVKKGAPADSLERKAGKEPGDEPKKGAKSKKGRPEGGAKRPAVREAGKAITVDVVPPEPPERFPPPYRGSVIIYTNELTAIGLSQSAELTYNPYYAMRIALSPRYWFTDKYYARAYLSLTTEMTQTDWTNDHYYWGDLDLGFGANGLYTIPFIEASLSAEVSMKLPTSEASRAATRVFSNKLSVGISRGFGRFSVALSTNLEKYWHRHTTGSPTKKLLGSCGASGVIGCIDALIQSGVRNASWSFSTGVNGSVKISDWLSVAADIGINLAFLYSLTEEELISWRVGDPQDTRYFLFVGLGATFKTTDMLTAVFGARSFHSQLAPEGSYRTPFINRHTQLYLDVRLSIDRFVSWLKK